MGTLVFVCPTTGFEVFTGLEMDQNTFADLPSVLPDIRCPHCPKPHQLSDVTAWLAEEERRTTGSPPAKLPHPRASAQLISRVCRRAPQANMRDLDSDRRGHGAPRLQRPQTTSMRDITWADCRTGCTELRRPADVFGDS